MAGKLAATLDGGFEFQQWHPLIGRYSGTVTVYIVSPEELEFLLNIWRAANRPGHSI